MILLDGKRVADKILREVENRRKYYEEETWKSPTPSLAIITTTNADDASEIYIRSKVRACERVGFTCRVLRMDAKAYDPCWEMHRMLRGAQEVGYDAVIVQYPLANQELYSVVGEDMPPELDADCMSYRTQGAFYTGYAGALTLVPCTAEGIIRLLAEHHVRFDGKHAVVLGRSTLVGQPLAHLLQRKQCTVTLCHSHTPPELLRDMTRSADILVSAVGKTGFVTADMVKPGAVVVDVGINRKDGHVVGDVDFDSVSKVAGALTPVPGGVGPMTVATLMEHVMTLAERRVLS